MSRQIKSDRTSLLCFLILIGTIRNVIARTNLLELNPGERTGFLRRKMQGHDLNGGDVAATIRIGGVKLDSGNLNLAETEELISDYSWLEQGKTEEKKQEKSVGNKPGKSEEKAVAMSDLSWLDVESDEIYKVVTTNSMPTSNPTRSPASIASCSDVPGFSVEIRKKVVTCEYVAVLEEETKNLVCDRKVNFNSEYKKVEEFCKKSCDSDCTETIPLTTGLQSCQDSLGFHVEIRGKKVDCDVVRFQMPHVTEILCERITQYEYSSHPIKYHCPEACDFDCTKSVSTKVQCADKTEFMVNIRGKDVTCELVSLLDARTQAVLCAHSEYWNGKMQTIDQFCPIACGKNDCAVTTGNAPMKNTTPECLDDEDFMVSIRGKNASCEFVSLASKSIQSILCERLVAWNGKSQTIDKFCPVACGSGCVAVSTQQSTATHKDKCLDNRDFMTNVRGKGVTCEFISSSNTSIRSILCGRSGTWNGKTQTIDKFCPSACRNDCTTKDPMLPPPPAVSRTEIDTRCADDKDFMKSIRGTDITCRFVSLANTSIRSVLCERLETWKGRTQLLSRFCPLACGQGCTAVSSAQVSRIGRQSLTTDPTSGPSHTPSDIPSNNPTTSPTYNPTATPTYPPTVSPTYTPTLTPTFQPTRCAVRTEAERIRALADRYADSSSDITRPAQQKALEFIMQLGEDPCKENSYDLQRYVAVVWYYSTGGENWEDPGNYLNGEDECEWKGLVCEGGDSITRMIFNENNLKGSLPNEIQHLSKLRTLEADGNKLRGIIPEDITECMQLEAIHLENNFLEGTIPNKIGKLQKLKVLDVDKNILSGSLPSSLFDIMSLVILDLDNNYISGVIQPEIRKLINLKQMQLENNLFTGSIPNELGEIESLELIYLHGNDITGTMPQSVCKLQLNDIWANCGNGYPQLLCDCCTRCLDQNYQARGVKEGNKQDFSSFLAFLEGWWDLGLEEEP